MRPEEFNSIAKAIRTYYPRENFLPNQEAIALWYDALKDLDYKATETAVKAWVATNKWSPSIADLREGVNKITQPKIKDWSEAFEEARQAIRRFGWYNPKDALDSLDELTRETVRRMGYHDMCMSENHASDRANFRDIYNTLAERKKQERQIPEAIRIIITQNTQYGLPAGRKALRSKEE